MKKLIEIFNENNLIPFDIDHARNIEKAVDEKALKDYIGAKSIETIRYITNVDTKDSNGKSFKGVLLRIVYKKTNRYNSNQIDTITMELCVDTDGCFREVSGWGSGRTTFFGAYKYSKAIPDFNKKFVVK